jgi:hypothetical protein
MTQTSPAARKGNIQNRRHGLHGKLQNGATLCQGSFNPSLRLVQNLSHRAAVLRFDAAKGLQQVGHFAGLPQEAESHSLQLRRSGRPGYLEKRTVQEIGSLGKRGCDTRLHRPQAT